MPALVGRTAELEVLRAALEDARHGHGRLVLVSGEAGIGKTRLVEEVADIARSEGGRAAWGRAWEAGGAPEFWPWIEVLRSLGLSKAASELEGARVAADDAGARFRLFDRIAAAVRGGIDTATVIVLDDLHVADESTLRLTQLVVRSLTDVPVLLVGTHRDEGLASLADLSRVGTTVRLVPLSPAEIGALVHAQPAVAARIAEVCGGNPFFADELARLWVNGVDDRVPTGIREVVRRRVAALPTNSAEVLVAAAVIGRTFTIETVAATMHTSVGDVLDHLGPAAQADLIRFEHGGTARFEHDLVRAALIDALDPSTRARWHLAVVDALENTRGTPPALIAHHCWESVPLVERARAATWCDAAAARARASLAYDEAAGHWHRAADLADDEATRCSHLMHAGEAARRAGTFDRAQQLFRAAAEVALGEGDHERFAEAVLGVGGYADVEYRPEVIAMQERALALLPPGDSRLRALVLSNHATYLGNTERHLDGRRLSAEALAIARRADDDDTLATTLFDHHFLLIMDAAEHETRRALADELVALTDRLDDTERRVTARCWLAHDLLEAGDIAGMERELLRGAALSDAARLRFGAWATTYPMAFLALVRGDFEQAERLADDAYEAGSSLGFADVVGVDATFRFHLRRAQGRLGELMDAPVPPPPEALNEQFGSYRSAVSLGLAELGFLDEARDGLREIVSGRPSTMQTQAVALLLAETAILTGDAESARVLYDRLSPFAGRLVPSVIAGVPHGAVDRILGGLAGVLGDAETSSRLVESGRRLNEELGFRRWAAPPTPSTAAPLVTARSSRVTRAGEYWTFEHGKVTSRLKDSPGIRHLARLLLEPEREHHALDLIGSTGVDDGGSGAVLDASAKEQYRRRLVDLQDDIDDATAANDIGRAERARIELDALIEQLSAGVGLGGRDRQGSTATERARQSVTRSIKRAVDRVVDADPALGAHLRATVKTGIYSSYTPDPAAPVTWS